MVKSISFKISHLDLIDFICNPPNFILDSHGKKFFTPFGAFLLHSILKEMLQSNFEGNHRDLFSFLENLNNNTLNISVVLWILKNDGDYPKPYPQKEGSPLWYDWKNDGCKWDWSIYLYRCSLKGTFILCVRDYLILGKDHAFMVWKANVSLTGTGRSRGHIPSCVDGEEKGMDKYFVYFLMFNMLLSPFCQSKP